MTNLAVGYVRRSTDRQEASLDDQEDAIREYAAAQGFDLLRLYRDDAISGTSVEKRDGFRRLIADAQGGRDGWRFLIVYDVSRFGRFDNDEAGHYRFLLKQAGVEVLYVRENLRGDDTDDILRPVLQYKAREYSRGLSADTIRGQVSLVEKASWPGGTPPYGFDLLFHDADGRPYQVVRWMGDGTKQILDLEGRLLRTQPRGERVKTSKRDRAVLVPSLPERVAAVRRIFDEYLGGTGFKNIAVKLNNEGVPSPRNRDYASIHDGHWSPSSIRAILMNPAYRGDLAWNRTTAAKFHKVSGKRAVARERNPRSRVERNDADDWPTTGSSSRAPTSPSSIPTSSTAPSACARQGVTVHGRPLPPGAGEEQPLHPLGARDLRRLRPRLSGDDDPQRQAEDERREGEVLLLHLRRLPEQGTRRLP